MRKVIYSLLLALTASPGLAANLFFLGGYDFPNRHDRYYADLDNVARKNGLVIVRTVMVFGSPFVDGAAGPVTYNIATNAISCSAQEKSILAIDEYDAKNRQVKHYDFPNDYYPIHALDKILASKVCH